MYAVSVPAALVLLAGATWLPKSPRWLLLRNRREEAIASLRRLRGGGGEATDNEMREMEAATVTTAQDGNEGDEKNAPASPWSALLEARSLKALGIGLSLIIFQQITGQPSVLYYATKIFQDAGFRAAEQATAVSVGLGVFKLVATFVAVALVDSAGRRPLLIAGVSVIFVSLIVLGAAASAAASPLTAGLSVAALLLYVGAYQVSFGPIAWLVVGEIFPLEIRNQAVAICTLANFGGNALVSQLLPSIQAELGQGGAYFLFAFIAAIALAVITAIVPETKGKTLEEIQALLDSGDGDTT